MRKRRSLLLLTLVPLAIAVVPALSVTPARAQPAKARPSSDAQAKFEQAQKRYDTGDFAAAVALFKELVDESNSPNARLYLARSLRELGQLPASYEEMRRTVRDATERSATEERYQETRRAAEAELAKLESRVARVVLTMAAGAPEGAEVKIDGRALPADKIGQSIALAPGEILIEASAPGQPPFSRRVVARAGVEDKIEIAFRGEAAPPPPSPATPPPGPTGGGIRIAGYVVAGVGVAGMILFAAAGASAQSKFDAIVEECGGQRCTEPRYADEISTGETLTTLANVGLVVGIAGLTGGAAMILLGGPKDPPPETGSIRRAPGPAVSARISPRGVAVAGTF